MKVYKCDSCDVMIDNPHKVRMKEFCFEVSNCDPKQIFMPVKRKKKIHLCANCYRGLYTLAKREELSEYEKSTKCNQVCEYNSSDGCVVRKRNGVCPLLNVSTAETTEQLVETKDVLLRDNQRYEVVIADDNIFVICPVAYDAEEESKIVNYEKTEIYANQLSINTLEELRFKKCK